MSDLKMIGVRIEKTEFYQQKHYTVVSAPSPDPFSFPNKYRVVSQTPFGNVGNVVDLDLNMRGIVRQKQYVDRSTGQQKVYDESDVYFDLVQARPHVAQGPVSFDKKSA